MNKPLNKLDKEIAKLEKKHDKIENPVCYSGNCPICNKLKELERGMRKK